MILRFSIAVRVMLPAALLALAACQKAQTQASGPPPPVPVSVAVATEQSVPSEIHVVGTVEPSAVIQVKSQIGGVLMKTDFVEGSEVKQGDLLFEIDPRPYQEALKQAQATLARDTAQMRQAEANLAKDKAQAASVEADAARNAALAKDGIVSKTLNEQSQASAGALHASIEADQAAIESAKALLNSDQAAIDKAKLDLSYCEIRSPVTGRTGNLLVHTGNLVAANGSNPLVVINRLQPIWVSFGVPEEHLTAVRSASASRQLPVIASPQDSPGQTARGVLTVIDNTVDPSTGTIKLKATFDNERRLLWPGQFVDVSLTVGTQSRAIVVPSEAVQPGQNGQMVYVVKPGGTVEPRNVTAGVTYGKSIIIEKGLAAGESVVTDGQLRLFPGARIQAVPASKIDSRAL